MQTQLKFVVDQSLAEQFKRAVLRKHGKMSLSQEGAEALRLYLREQQGRQPPAGRDPLLQVIGSARSTTPARPSALRDKRRLYDEA